MPYSRHTSTGFIATWGDFALVTVLCAGIVWSKRYLSLDAATAEAAALGLMANAKPVQGWINTTGARDALDITHQLSRFECQAEILMGKGFEPAGKGAGFNVM